MNSFYTPTISENYTSLIQAINCNDVDLTRKYAQDASIDSLNKALLHSMHNLNYRCIKILLMAGANPQAYVYANDWSPLHIAVKKKLADLVALLLDYGAKNIQPSESSAIKSKETYRVTGDHNRWSENSCDRKTPRFLDSETYDKGWLKHENRKNLNEILSVLMQANRQHHPIFADELLLLIINYLTQQYNLKRITSLEKARTNFTKIGVECFLSKYNGMWFYPKSYESLDLAKNLDADKNYRHHVREQR
jgi:ankyrin repeat protein